jgi:biopolymer transport protein TolR
MGMSVGNKSGGVQSDINVTPLIDVLLVLLIIFLIAMPIVMKMETLEVPRKLNNEIEMPDPNANNFTVTVHADMSMTFNDGDHDTPIQFADLVHTLGDKFKNQHVGTDKVVFVDFEDGVQWKTVLSVMDTIRSLASDNAPPDDNHNEIKVALKVKNADDANAPK